MIVRVSLLRLRDCCVCEWRQIPDLNVVRFWMVTILCFESSCSCGDDRQGGLTPCPNRHNASRIIARAEREREMPRNSWQMAAEWVRDNNIFVDCGFRLFLRLSTAGCSVYDVLIRYLRVPSASMSAVIFAYRRSSDFPTSVSEELERRAMCRREILCHKNELYKGCRLASSDSE
jgi:hypothetical protein